MDLAEEGRRRKNYVSARKRRSDLEAAEVRLGFLVNQTKGWSGEFERLQSFTGAKAVLWSIACLLVEAVQPSVFGHTSPLWTQRSRCCFAAGMETKFEPGEPDIVDEITSRFKDKERANTSLLAYQGEQQLEMNRIADEIKEVWA